MEGASIKLVVAGAAEVDVTSTSIRANDATSTFENGVLTINSVGNEAAYYMGQTVVNNRGSSVVCSGSITVAVSGRDVTVSGPCKRIRLNGRDVPLSSANDTQPAIAPRRVDFAIPDGTAINSISGQGSSAVRFKRVAFPKDSSMTMKLSGQTSVNFDGASFGNMTCVMSGQSSMKNAKSDNANLILSGMSKISALHVRKSATAVASGMATINGTRENDAAIVKESSGMASIKFSICPEKQ